MRIVVLTTGHRPDDDRIYYKEIISLLTKYPRIDLVAPVVEGETYNLDSAVVLHPLKKRDGVVGRLLTSFAAAVKVIRLKPNVCHFHDLDFVLMAPFVRLFSGAKLVYDVHEVYPDRMLISERIPKCSRRVASVLVDVFEKWCAQSCSLILCAVEPISERFRLTHVPTLTIFNYPRLSLFEPNPRSTADLAKRFKGRHIIVYHGTMGQDNRLLHMLEGIALLKKENPDVLLLLIGLNSPELKAKTDRLIENYRIHDYVCIIPWVPHSEIANFLAIAKVGLVPAQPSKKSYKGIALKTFEYMACGVPVLGAIRPASIYYVAQSGAGILYDSTDVHAFAREIARMLRCPEELVRMGKAGRTAVSEQWNWAKMEVLLLKAYSELEYSLL